MGGAVLVAQSRASAPVKPAPVLLQQRVAVSRAESHSQPARVMSYMTPAVFVTKREFKPRRLAPRLAAPPTFARITPLQSLVLVEGEGPSALTVLCEWLWAPDASKPTADTKAALRGIVTS